MVVIWLLECCGWLLTVPIHCNAQVPPPIHIYIIVFFLHVILLNPNINKIICVTLYRKNKHHILVAATFQFILLH